MPLKYTLTLLFYSTLQRGVAFAGFRESRDGTNRLWGNSFGIPGVNETYDYQIIGGGTVGNALAARLAVDPRRFSVAVIEAGSFYDNENLTEIPGYNGWSTHIDNSRPSLVEWDIEAVPQPKTPFQVAQ
ncbi:hypothetical protein F5884DRAFT_150668 [Xylogone sp. PMI_703]|nr:hypothetical protein F5884DRAFT_150668 [Xylogone sp. PMI_703]